MSASSSAGLDTHMISLVETNSAHANCSSCSCARFNSFTRRSRFASSFAAIFRALVAACILSISACAAAALALVSRLAFRASHACSAGVGTRIITACDFSSAGASWFAILSIIVHNTPYTWLSIWSASVMRLISILVAKSSPILISSCSLMRTTSIFEASSCFIHSQRARTAASKEL